MIRLVTGLGLLLAAVCAFLAYHNVLYAATPTFWVSKSDQAKSCERKPGITLAQMAKELTQANVRVLDQKKIHDGRMRILMCGADKGDRNAYLISRSDIEKAQGLGFAHTADPSP